MLAFQVAFGLFMVFVVWVIHNTSYEKRYGLMFGTATSRFYLRLKWDSNGFGYFLSFDTGRRMHNRMHNL